MWGDSGSGTRKHIVGNVRGRDAHHAIEKLVIGSVDTPRPPGQLERVTVGIVTGDHLRVLGLAVVNHLLDIAAHHRTRDDLAVGQHIRMMQAADPEVRD